MNDKTHKDDQETIIPLGDIRKEISQLDDNLLSLFARRRFLSKAVAVNKQTDLRPIRDQKREKELLEVLIQKGSESGLDSHFVTRIFHAIIEDSLAIQRDYLQSQSNPDYQQHSVKSIAILGGPGAYSYLAAKKHFSSSKNNYLGCSTFDKVIKSVELEKADFGVIPIENTTSGGITEVYDLLLDSSLTIIGEEKYPIKHCLVATPDTHLANVSKILAHPEASRQCNKNMKKIVSADVSLVSSTAEALQIVADSSQGELAAIASEKSALQFGLKVLQKDIANLKENTTRFLILSRQSQKVSTQVTCKTSIALSTGQKPGSLAEVLLVFRDANIPLTKLESRPIAGKPWEQMFYIDIQGNIANKNIEQALEEISKLCRFLKVLGSYATEDISATKVSTSALSKAKVSAIEDTTTNEQQAVNTDEQTAKQTANGNKGRKSYHLASREHKTEDTIIEVKNVKIGGDGFVVIGGPCAVESSQQIMACAKHANETGVSVLRGGCFKPRTSPYSFQGLGFEGVDLLQQAGNKYQLPIITEVMNTEDVRQIADHADMLQIGARNMQNFSLLKAVGQINRPVMLKRGLMASVEELLNAAEYILAQGNMQVFLCERGIRTFETATRNTLDLSAVPLLKQMTHLPIIVDPSHAVGKRELVVPMAKAAKAVGAHGVMVEFHPDPLNAASDGEQALEFNQFAKMMVELFTK